MATSTKRPERLAATWALLRRWHQQGHCRAIAAEVGSLDGNRETFAIGHLTAAGERAADPHSIFLIASPTKPLVVTAAMMLVEQGELQVDHHVQHYLPEFRGGGKQAIRLAHLMTHTSGLPDMLPNNETLRRNHAPLSEFMAHVHRLGLLGSPGSLVHYQSMGILALATVIEKVVGQPLPAYLKEVLWKPLGMGDTALGVPDSWAHSGHLQRIADAQIEGREGAEEWGWNSRYWRALGAPWGGLLSTAIDLGTFCRHLLEIHRGLDGVLARPTLQAMTSNRLRDFPALPEAVVRATPWGLGWQLNWPTHPRGFGTVLPAQAYGHWGATGTLLWLDPTRGTYGVVLTTEPMDMERRRQIAFANLSALV